MKVIPNTLGGKHQAPTWQSMEDWQPTQPLQQLGIDTHELAIIQQQVRARSLLFTVNVKGPRSWLVSYFRHSKQKALARNRPGNFEFDWTYCERLLDSWKTRVSQWLALADDAPTRFVIIQYLTLLEDPRSVLRRLRRQFDLPSNRLWWVTGFRHRTRKGGDTQRGRQLFNRHRRFQPTYYTLRQWRDEYPVELLLRVDQRIAELCAGDPRLILLARE